MDILDMTALQLSAAIKKGVTTAVEATEQMLSRIDAQD